MKEIRGDAKSIRRLLDGSKFAIDYYQREYRWKTKQVVELIIDLAEVFLESYKPSDDPSAVEHYGHYFLGSIIISNKGGKKFIIDGQQRITSVSLLLIYLYRQLKEDKHKGLLANLIFSLKFGKQSFNLEVPERTACMNALFTGEQFIEDGQPESVINIMARFQDIEDQFPNDLAGEALSYFADWLIENVYFVEITAYADADAYTIFETMNDRGLSLTPTDMLKGYLLANIKDPEARNEASQIWRDRVSALQKLGKEEDADAIKVWLRSQHADTIREGKAGAQPRDFELIGTEFHRWVRGHEKALSLEDSASFSRFIQKDFNFYSVWYERIRQAAETFTQGLETIYYNAWQNFTLQYPVLLAPLQRADSESQICQKLRIVATYINVLIARRIWNWKATTYSTMQYAMFRIIQSIRGKPANELADILFQRLLEEATFDNNDRFQLHGRNGSQIHWLLALMTNYVEIQSNQTSRFIEYIQRGGKNGYEVEHIWANHYERHKDEFVHPADFDEYRNRIGGLLLLRKDFNASFGDMCYKNKRAHYNSQNLLARSLYENAYVHNPGFQQFMNQTGLAFRPHAEFKKADLDARQDLYRNLAEHIWNPENLFSELSQ